MTNTLDKLIAEDPLPSPVEEPSATGSENATAPAAAKGATSRSNDLNNTSKGSAGTSSVAAEAVANYRAQFRAQNIPESYSEYRHLGGIFLWAGSAVLVTVWLAGGPSAMLAKQNLLAAALAFALANYFEWYAHRFKLHNPLAKTRHSHTHHRFFTDKFMEYDSLRDAHAIFFPEGAPKVLMLGVLPVLSIVPTLLGGIATGATFACTLAMYYLSYEVMHLSYHAHPDSFLGSLPGVAALRRHHQIHHQQALMGKVNFNITWPICDYLFGTAYKEPQQQQQPDATATKSKHSD